MRRGFASKHQTEHIAGRANTDVLSWNRLCRVFLSCSTGPSNQSTNSQRIGGTAMGQENQLDLSAFDGLVRKCFADGVARQTMMMHSVAQKWYLSFCQMYHVPPLSEISVCLFAAFLAHQALLSPSPFQLSCQVSDTYRYHLACSHLRDPTGLDCTMSSKVLPAVKR